MPPATIFGSRVESRNYWQISRLESTAQSILERAGRPDDVFGPNNLYAFYARKSRCRNTNANLDCRMPRRGGHTSWDTLIAGPFPIECCSSDLSSEYRAIPNTLLTPKLKNPLIERILLNGVCVNLTYDVYVVYV